MIFDFYSISNHLDFSKSCQSPYIVAFRASFIYTEAFLLLSGFLTSYSLTKRLKNNQKINFFKEIALRYFRVVPPMAALILFTTYVLPVISSGPQYGNLIRKQAQLCEENWWKNFLLIHNWFGRENICVGHTHHVATDFQLFLFSMIFYVISEKKSLVLILMLAVFSTFGRFYTSLIRDISVYVAFGAR